MIIQFGSLMFQLCDFAPLGITIVRFWSSKFQLRDFGPLGFNTKNLRDTHETDLTLSWVTSEPRMILLKMTQ